MNKFPMDVKEVQELASSVIQQNEAQNVTILKLAFYLKEAIERLEGRNAQAIPIPASLGSYPDISDSEAPMTEAELADYFNEPVPEKKPEGKPVETMTKEEIHTWEAQQDNSTEIYKIAARVKNLARSDGQASLLPAGEALCNLYVHAMKSFYDFADTLPEDSRRKMYILIQKQESLPGNVISAGIGTKGDKNRV